MNKHVHAGQLNLNLLKRVWVQYVNLIDACAIPVRTAAAALDGGPSIGKRTL